MKNPITALSDLFGKLIIEHGSAIIQEKHIALFKDELMILGKKLTESDSRIEQLESENQNLKTENTILKKKIQSYEKSTHEILLSEIEIKVLIFLAKQEHAEITPEHIAQSLNTNLPVISFHLEDLRAKKFIESRPVAPFDHSPRRFWSLAQEGRRYLIKHKLIS